MNIAKSIKWSYLIFLGVTISLFSCSDSAIEKTRAEEPQISQEETLTLIESKMLTQENSWNSGDLNGFMQSYWQSDSLLFLGKSGISYGWQTTLDNYISGYPSKEAMGQLHFKNEIVRFIDVESIQVIGKWHLQREGKLEDLEGHYSLIWKKKNGNWVIISDHSS